MQGDGGPAALKARYVSASGQSHLEGVLEAEATDWRLPGGVASIHGLSLPAKAEFRLDLGTAGPALSLSETLARCERIDLGALKPEDIEARIEIEGARARWRLDKAALLGGTVFGWGTADWSDPRQPRIEIERLSPREIDLDSLLKAYGVENVEARGKAQANIVASIQGGRVIDLRFTANAHGAPVYLDRQTVLWILSAGQKQPFWKKTVQKEIEERYGSDALVRFELAYAEGELAQIAPRPTGETDSIRVKIDLENEFLGLTIEPRLDSIALLALLDIARPR
ncbi:MAG: hypothetical protein BWZ10_02830 [candidate division BRC1 bacterium ADurb.BinA364]|nr:MAG: hypothetical protein BWZ10_02830 [candidate division BRC1 bacterium ADurb.BinA364]